MFWNRIKKKIRNIYILHITLCLVFAALMVFIAFITGFLGIVGYKAGGEELDGSGQVLNIVFSVIAICLFIGSVVLMIRIIKDMFRNAEYYQFLKKLQELGDAEEICREIDSTSECKLNKCGELRFSKKYFFYMEGSDISFFPTSSIISLKPLHGKYDYLVKVHSKNCAVTIKTNKKNQRLLLNAIEKAKEEGASEDNPLFIGADSI